MLEKPDLPDDELIACLQRDYGLRVGELAFLPLGNDVNTAVYRAIAGDGTPYFLKLRSGPFDEALVEIPRLLHEQGIAPIIAPIETRAGGAWTRLGDYAVILHPFVEGEDGYDHHLSDRHWVELGIALRGLHTAVVPDDLSARLPRETFSPYWRDMVRSFQMLAEETAFADPVAATAGELLRTQRDTISKLIARTEQLAATLQAQSLDYVLCHADFHAWNVLIDVDDVLYIVDWDTLILAPKERDLMFIGSGLGNIWNDPREEALFYQGYGPTEVDPVGIAYYRYERIIEDIASFGEQLLLSDEGGADREQSLKHLASNFLPGGLLEHTYRTDSLLRAE